MKRISWKIFVGEMITRAEPLEQFLLQIFCKAMPNTKDIVKASAHTGDAYQGIYKQEGVKKALCDKNALICCGTCHFYHRIHMGMLYLLHLLCHVRARNVCYVQVVSVTCLFERLLLCSMLISKINECARGSKNVLLLKIC